VKYTWSGANLTQQWDSTTQRKINYTYEATYNQVTKVFGDVDTTWHYWSSGHRDSTLTAGGMARYTYAASGRMLTGRDPGGHTTTYHYQSSGFQNTDTVYFSVGKISYQYDGHGQRTQTTDQVKAVTAVQYDSIGRVLKTIGHLHDTTTNTYDAFYLTQVRDAKGQVYKFWPNAVGWADSTTDPAGAVDRYAYDLNGNQASSTNRKAQTIQYTYDSLDQVRSATAGGKTITWFTDPAGRYQAAADSESVDTLRLDTAGRVSVQVSCRVLVSGNAPQCFRDSSSYDTHDLRLALVLSGPPVWSGTQYTIGYHYDAWSRLDTLSNGTLTGIPAQKTRYAYGIESLITSKTHLGLNNLNVSYQPTWTHMTDEVQLSDSTLNAALGWGYYYDSLGRVVKAKHGTWNAPDTVRSIAYDSAGQLVAFGDSAYTYQQVPDPCTRSMAGDPCPNPSPEITVAWVRNGTFKYDSVQNRKDTLATSGGLDPANRLRRWQRYRMDYDLAGNLTRKRLLSATDTTVVVRTDSLYWGALGLLDSVRTRDSVNTLTRVGFGYDALGRRIRKSIPGSTSRYLWDGDQVVAEVDSLGALRAGYTYALGTDNPESVLRHDRNDTTYYYLQNRPGTVVALLKKTGTTTAIANRYGYDPFGVPQGGAVTVPDALQFAAREYDAETQLYYNRARYYDPAVGRFASEDPAGLSAGINLYAYVGNDPVNGRDPSGLCSKPSSGSGDKERKRKQYSYVACMAMAADAWLRANTGMTLDEALAKADQFGGDMFCNTGGCGQGYTGLFAMGCTGGFNATQCAQIGSVLNTLSRLSGVCGRLGQSATNRFLDHNFQYDPFRWPSLADEAGRVTWHRATSQSPWVDSPITWLNPGAFFPGQLGATIIHEEVHHVFGMAEGPADYFATTCDS
jgi:RHS repeat-associated protein